MGESKDKLLKEFLLLMDEFKYESDEDSCMGMAFFEARLSEDYWFDLYNRTKKSLTS